MQGGSQGYVRTWTQVDDTLLLYGIGGNRCGTVQGCAKSTWSCLQRSSRV